MNAKTYVGRKHPAREGCAKLIESDRFRNKVRRVVV